MLNDDGLIWRSRFTNTVFLNVKLWPNDTEVSLHMTPLTDEPNQQHIAFEKYKYVLSKILQNSIFVEHDEQEHKAFNALNNDVIDFFSRPKPARFSFLRNRSPGDEAIANLVC